MRTKAIDRGQFISRRTEVMWAARMAILVASTFWILMAAPLALYPGAQLDQEFERDHLRNPKSELKPRRGDQLTRQRPHDGRHQREAYADQRGGYPKAPVSHRHDDNRYRK